jgi:hypothetical protein
MKVAMTRIYRQNRAEYPLVELQNYHGKWVAFTADGRGIVASGESISELCDQLRAAGQDPQGVVFERIDIDPSGVSLGGAELL